MNRRSGKGCSTSQGRLWPSPTGPGPISVRRPPWGGLPQDLRSIAFYRTGRKKEALEAARAALALEPENERIQGNVALLERETDGG